jgi:hypothetical protein
MKFSVLGRQGQTPAVAVAAKEMVLFRALSRFLRLETAQ